MPYIHEPYDKEIYHTWRPLPVPPEPHGPIRPLPYIALIVLAVLGLWGLTNTSSTRARMGVEEATAHVPLLQQPAEAAPAPQSTSSANLRLVPLPALTQTTTRGIGGRTGAYIHGSCDQRVDRAIAQLDSEIGRTQRLAERVGQTEAFQKLKDRHDALTARLTGQSRPWTPVDRKAIEAQTRALIDEVSVFTTELQEIASVQL